MAFGPVRGRSAPASRRYRPSDRSIPYDRHLGALTAAAEKLQDRLNKNGTAGGQVGQAWQSTAWDFYDRIPELRTASRITGQAMSQCRLILARVGDGGEPIPLDIGTPDKPGADAEHPAVDLLRNFAGGAGGQSEILDKAGTFLTVPGEFIVAGKMLPEEADPAIAEDRLTAYSPDQIRSTAGSKIILRTDESATSDLTLDEDDGYTAIRVWRPHPRYSWRPDSATKSSFPVLEEIVMYDSHTKANGSSRLAGRGILFVQEDITLPGSTADQDPQEDGTQTDPFLLLLMEVAALAYKDQESAAAMIPILARAADVEKAAKLVDFNTPFDDKVAGQRKDALARFAVAVDMPPEILTGFGALQHWTGALVSEDWKNSYLATLMGFVCGSFTSGWLLPALVRAGYGDLPNDVIIWYDDSSVRTREDSAAEAKDAYDRGEISGDAYRRAVNFDDSDKPTPEQLLEQIAKVLLMRNSNLAPLLLGKLGITFSPEELAVAESLQKVVGNAAPPGVPGEAESASGTPTEPVITSLPETTDGNDG